MDFGEILNQWEHRAPASAYRKDRETESVWETPPERRKRLLRKRPDGTIDLHGLSRNEAWDALAVFFDNAREKGFEKLLVIHGKGNHTDQENSGVLKETVRNFIERCPFAGESGHNGASGGGTGSTWVLLKNRKGSTLPVNNAAPA
jgi:DNA-nicking Smr family endonuclease